MITGTYRIAEQNIEIHSLYPEIHRLCREYRCNGEPGFSVFIDAEDILFEREKSAREDLAEGRPVSAFSDAYLETLAVYRKIAEVMPVYQTFLFHGSCIAVDGAGYLFTARSGTGKSTHTRLWRELLAERAIMINDDKPLIRVTDAGATVFGTPWDGKHHLSTNTSVPLRALCLLERAPENHISTLSPARAYPMLLQQIYRPEKPAAMVKTMTLLDQLLSSVRIYQLGCNMDLSAARLAWEAMREKSAGDSIMQSLQ